MTITVTDNNQLALPPRVRRQAGIKAGDRVEVKASPGTITITAAGQAPPTYRPTKAELAAIRKGEAEIERGESVTLTDLLHELDTHRRKGGAKTAHKTSR